MIATQQPVNVGPEALPETGRQGVISSIEDKLHHNTTDTGLISSSLTGLLEKIEKKVVEHESQPNKQSGLMSSIFNPKHSGIMSKTESKALRSSLTATGLVGALDAAKVAGAGLGIIGPTTFTFKPLEIRLHKDQDIAGKIEPYCKFKLGWHSGKSSIAKKQGNIPFWTNDAIILQRKHHEDFAKLKVKDRHRFFLKNRIGKVKIPLNEIALLGQVSKWYPLTKHNEVIGEIHLEIGYHGPLSIIHKVLGRKTS